MRSILLVPAVFCGLVLAGGCAQETPKDDPNILTIEEAPQQFARTICRRAYDCCTPMQLMSNKSAGMDFSTCVVESSKMLRDQMRFIAEEEQKGRLVFRGDKLAACLDRIRGATCQELNRTNRLSGLDCGEPYIEPLVAPGGACALDSECRMGRCVKAEGATEGTCLAQAAVNQPCTNEIRCASGLYCGDLDQLCKPIQPDGTSCSSPKECSSGRCDTSSGAPLCAPPAANMCFYSSSCAAAGPATPSAAALMVCLVALLVAARRQRRAKEN